MKQPAIIKTLVCLALGAGCFLMLLQAISADTTPISEITSLPQILKEGFTLWPKGGAGVALDTWQKGGLMDGDNSKNSTLTAYFKEIDRSLGNLRSAEWVDGKTIGKSSQIVYLSINFERGAVFGKFVLYRAGANWVVQDMVFNTRPEFIMPWLATEGNRSTE